MQTNAIPRNPGQLYVLTQSILDGLQHHGATLLLPPNLSHTVTEQRDLTRRTEHDHLDTKSALGVLRTERQEKRRAITRFVGHAMDVLRPHLGKRWTPAWFELGMPSGHLRIPKSHDERMRIVANIEAHLRAHPEREVPAAGITASAAAALQEQMSSLEHQTNSTITRVRQLRADYQRQFKQLQRHLRLVRGALHEAFSADDPRWCAFGFHHPIDTRLPDVPEEVTLRQEGQVLLLQWQPAARATHYRVNALPPGETTPQFVRATTSQEMCLEAMASDVALVVTAVNAAGESRPSSPASHLPSPWTREVSVISSADRVR